MIQKMLQREPNNSWAIPNSDLLAQIQETLKTCEQKCEATANRLLKSCSDKVGAKDFTADLEILKGRIVDLTERLSNFNSNVLDDLDREALTAAFVKTAVSFQEIKKKNANPRLFDEIELVYVRNLNKELDRLLGEVPEGYYSTHTKQLAADARKLPCFEAFCNRLRNIKAEFYSEHHPSLAISFSFNDHEMACLVNELLKMATTNVHFFEDDGPKSGRAIGYFLQHLEQDAHILVIGSSSYGEKARSPLHSGVRSEARVIVERYNSNPKHVVRFLVEGAVTTSFPSEMAHSQHGYLDATSPDKLFSSIARVLERVYYYSKNPQLKAELEEMKRDFSSSGLNLKAHNEEKSSGFLNLEPILTVYRRQGYLSRFLDKKPIPIDKGYINLAIIDQQSSEKIERETWQLDPLSSRDAFYHFSQRIELAELFDGNAHLFIEGTAGSGKTTLCRYLVYTWAISNPQKRLELLGPWANQYEALILLPLREIRSLSKTATLRDFILKRYPGFPFDKLDPSKTLYILDGFDEIASLEEACRISSEDKRWTIVEVLMDQPHWMITSRHNLFSERFYDCKRLQNSGFTDENIFDYVECFCSDFKVESKTLKQALLFQKDLKILAHTPLYLELFCSLWKENPDPAFYVLRIENLYDQMAIYLFRRLLMRLDVSTRPLYQKEILNHPSILHYREYLEAIAFDSKKSGGNRVEPKIYRPHLEKIDTDEREAFGKRLFDDFGLLTPFGDPKELFDQVYSFIHPTFEEYFVARFILSHLDSPLPDKILCDWLKVNFLSNSLEKVIDFAAGLAETEPQLNALAEGLLSAERPKNSESNGWQFPLTRAAAKGLLKLSEALLERGAKVDAASETGWQPLHFAARNGHKEVVELLLSKEAKVDAAINTGQQPLHLAVESGNKEVVELLLSKGAKVDACYNVGLQPLHMVETNIELVVLLVTKGAKVDAIDRVGCRPLHYAAWRGNKEVAEILLELGAKVDATNRNGWQPLHYAALSGHKEIVLLLLSKGASAGAVDYTGKRASYWAETMGHKEVVDLLRARE